MRAIAAISLIVPDPDGSMRLSPPHEGYPPCDILSTRKGGLRVVLAVAGFGIDELSVSVEGDQLVVRGRRNPDPGPRCFLYRGIAMRRFQRTFVLGPGLQVASARLEHGLLGIEVEAAAGNGVGKGTPIGGPGPKA